MDEDPLPDLRQRAREWIAGFHEATEEDRVNCVALLLDAAEAAYRCAAEGHSSRRAGDQLNRLVDPHPQDEHCNTGDLDHCLSHGVDEGQAGAYRICPECWHAFPSAAALLADHAALVERLNANPPAPPSGLFGGPMVAETDPEQIRFCPQCGHDF